MSYNLDAQRRALMGLTPPPLSGQVEEKPDKRLAHAAVCSLSAEHFGCPEFRLYECLNKAEVQAAVKELTGSLPSDLEDAGWADGDTLYMVIRRGCSYARIAHEAVHAAVLWGASKGIDAADMTLHRLPGNPEYGWIPGEIIAELVEQIVLFVTHGRFCSNLIPTAPAVCPYDCTFSIAKVL